MRPAGYDGSRPREAARYSGSRATERPTTLARRTKRYKSEKIKSSDFDAFRYFSLLFLAFPYFSLLFLTFRDFSAGDKTCFFAILKWLFFISEDGHGGGRLLWIPCRWSGPLLWIAGSEAAGYCGSQTPERPATVDRRPGFGRLLWIADLAGARCCGSRALERPTALDRGHRSGPLLWIVGSGTAGICGSRAL